MHPRRPTLPLAVLAAAAALSSLACGGGYGAGTTSTVSVTPTLAAPAGSPGSITLQIVTPAEGGTVTNPFTLRVQAAGIPIAAASEREPGAAHFHAFLDQAPVAEGKLIPSGSGIFHFTDSVDLRAPAGQHTIVVVLGDNDHVRLKGAPTAQVTANVQ